MQVYGSPYKTCIECTHSLLKTEGLQAFYRSFTTQLTMNIPFQSIHFMTYEIMQDWLNKERNYDPKTHVVSGGMAGAIAAVVTMPLDVCKTLLNTQEHCSRTHINYINGMIAAFRTVYEFQGLPGYFRGLQARVVMQIPATAISWSTYEFFKYFIAKRSVSSDYLSVNGIHLQTASAAASSRWCDWPVPLSRT